MRPLSERFFEKVFPDPNTSCWIWGGATSRGYGYTYFMGKSTPAHRVSYLIENGYLEDEYHVLHKCDNPWCVNPEHLFLGTHKDNMRDMWSKGRGVLKRNSGEDQWQSKLTWEDVEDIRASKEKQKTLAKRYGVYQQTISRVKTGKGWKTTIDVELRTRDEEDG